MPDNVLTQPAAGGSLVQTPEAAEALRELHGVQPVSPEGQRAAAAVERRRKMFDTTEDKLFTVAEGIVDAFMGGLVHETGDAADIRREVNAGSAFLGNALGIAGAAVTGRGPAAAGIKLGEVLGKKAAVGALRQAEKAIATTALKEAGAGAIATAQYSFGHALLDTVIEDRPFAGEAILADGKLGGILGGAGGGLIGLLGKVASRGTVRAQGGLIGGVDDALDHLESSRAAYGEALHTYEAQVGAMKEFRKAGKLHDISDDFIRVRTDAVRRARDAQKAVQDLDIKAALSGADPVAYKDFQRRWGEYVRAMDEVDDVIRIDRAERSGLDALENPGTQVRERPVRPVTPGEDFVVPASRVGEAIPDSADYARAIAAESPTPPVVDGAPSRAAGGTVGGRPGNVTPTQAPGLAELDEAIKQIPLRSGHENAQVAAAVIDGPGPGALADHPSQIDRAIAGMFRQGNKAELVARAQASRAPKAAPARAQLSMDPPPAPTVKEDLPAGKLAGALEKAAASEKTGIRRVVREAINDAVEPSKVAQDLMDRWVNAAEPRTRPWFEAQARARGAMETLYQKAGGRLDSARSLGILEADGITPSTDLVGSYMDSVYAMNRAGRFAADEARGIASPLRDAAMQLISGRLARAVLGNAAAGPLGAMIGFTAIGGRMAASAGRLLQSVADATSKFLSTTKVRSVAIAAANTPWEYSDRGPIEDPVERIQEIQFLASNPDAIRARVAESAGELAHVAPEQVRAIADAAVRQITHLAVRAPAVYFDKLGRPLSPPQGKLRQFYEFENAMHDLPGLLKALGDGTITKPQADALQAGWSSVHVKAAQFLLQDPARIQKMDRAKLRVLEMVTGMSFTGASDPFFLARQQAAWQPVQAPTAEPALKPQAFNINPDGAPTPSQANAQGRAPGNE